MRNFLASAMVITMALCLYTAVLRFGGVGPDLAGPTYGLIVLLALMWAAKLFFAKSVSWKNSPLHLPVAGFFFYALGRYFFSPLEYESRLDLIEIGFCALVYFICAANFYRARDRSWFIWALLLLAIFESTYGLWQFALKSHTIFGVDRPEQYYGRGGGTYMCPNHLAGFLEIVIGLLVGRLVFLRSSKLSIQGLALRKIALGYGVLIVLAGLIASLSRGGWMGATAAFGSLIFWGGWEFRKLSLRLAVILLGIGMLAGMCVGITPVRNFVQLTFSGQDKEKAVSLSDESLGGRTMLWKSTTEMIKDHPVFGTGGMTWEWIFPKYRSPEIKFHYQYAHNDVLHYTSDYGLVGLVLLAAVIVCFFGQSRLLSRDTTSPDQRSFAIGAALATTAILVHSCFDFNMHIFGNALLLSAIFGFTAAAEDGEHRFKRLELGRVARYALGTLIVIISFAAIWFVAPTCLAARYTQFGNGAKEDLASDAALAYYQKAISLDPGFWEPYSKMGDIYRSQAEWRDRSRETERKHLARKAVASYVKALSLHPLHSDMMLRQARAYELLGENDRALKCYERALGVDPNSAFAHASLGRFYMHIGEDKKAEKAFARSEELNWFSGNMARFNLQDLKNPR